ncbi:MAG: hypothetical protein IKL95_00685 [Alphaproteobacteria bacterium]|nr:hypothetical protein [Alphaproteobacteria bacterium]
MNKRFKSYPFKAFHAKNNPEPLITTECSEETCPVLVYGKGNNMIIQEGISLQIVGFYQVNATDRYFFDVVGGAKNQLKQTICDICNKCQAEKKTR